MLDKAQQPAASEGSTKSSAGGKRPISPKDLMSKPATWAIIVVNTVNHWG